MPVNAPELASVLIHSAMARKSITIRNPDPRMGPPMHSAAEMIDAPVAAIVALCACPCGGRYAEAASNASDWRMKRVALTERKKLSACWSWPSASARRPARASSWAARSRARAAERAAPIESSDKDAAMYSCSASSRATADQGESRQVDSHRRASSRRPKISAASTQSVDDSSRLPRSTALIPNSSDRIGCALSARPARAST